MAGNSIGMKFTSLILLLSALTVSAANPTNQANVTLAWDRSPDDLLTNGISYRVYAGTNLVSGAVNSITNINSGTNISVTFTNMQPATWYFSATALQGGIESLPSNIAIYSIPSVRPRPPGSLATVFLELTLDLTNYTDVGMFRAKIFVPKP
jgi:hypothetical protein